jgi:opacity protein-like surface antigen
MRTDKPLLLTLFLLQFPLAATANNVQVDVNGSITFLDAGGNDDFESGRALSVFFDYSLKPWLALDAGLLVSDKAQDEIRTDIVGTYQASLGTRMLLLGIKPRYQFEGPFEIYGRAGLTYWRTEIEVEEYFNDSIPGGVATDSDKGYGYYLNFGALHNVTQQVSVQIELSYMQQLDVFEGKSNYPFDLTITGIGIGIGYRF